MLIPTTNYYIPDGNRLVDVATLARPQDLDELIADLEMMGENRPGEELSASVYSRSITRTWPGPLPDELIDLLLDEEQSAEFIISVSPEDGSTQHLVIRDGRLVENIDPGEPQRRRTRRPGGRAEHLLHTQRVSQTDGDGALPGHRPRASVRRRGNVRSGSGTSR